VPVEKRAFWERQYGCSPYIEDVQEIIDQQFSHAVIHPALKRPILPLIGGLEPSLILPVHLCACVMRRPRVLFSCCRFATREALRETHGL
jgi:hypothetical protein